MRHIFVLGTSHKTAGVAERERLAMALAQPAQVLGDLRQNFALDEVAALSTCNRSEIYLALGDACRESEVRQALTEWWAAQAGLHAENHFYWYGHREAVEHVYRVATSLDSLLLGEAQILGQLRDAYGVAADLGHAKRYLHHLFQSALALGKETRSRTGIGQGALSISLAAVRLCRKVFGALDGRTAVVVGAGEMARLACLHFRQSGIGRLIVVNRNLDRARLLAEAHGGEAWPWDKRTEALLETDVLVSATSAPSVVLEATDVRQSWHRRRGREAVLVDIAIPRDLDERLGDLDGVFLFGVDDLRDVVDEGRQIRQGATARVEELLHEHLNDFVDWYRAREAVPAIVHLRSALEQETANELERWRGHPAQDAIAKALRGMAGRFLHGPSEALRELGQEGQGVEASAWMSRIFGTVDPSTKE